jgi:hypothetical protein
MQVRSTNVPENIQAWTVSAIFAITANRRPGIKVGGSKPALWQTELEQEVLMHIPKMDRFKTSYALNARYPDYPYQLKKDIA